MLMVGAFWRKGVVLDIHNMAMGVENKGGKLILVSFSL